MARYQANKRLRKSLLSPARTVAAAVVIALIVFAVLELTNTTHFFHKTNSSKTVVTVGSPVSPPKQSSASSSAQPAPKTPTSNTGRNIGGATDTHGTATTTTNSSQWVTSDSGLITVKQPVANAKIQDGSVLSGSAKVSEVQYRLNDNQKGVIAEGTLEVVNGDFSGTLHFSPSGTGARLDVFSTDSKGVEYNEVQINVSY